MKKQIGFLLFFLNGCGLVAQNLNPDTLRRQFHTYQLQTPQEKLFVHTDKTFYLTGETIWFKAYLIDASFHRPAHISSITYIEVLNKDLKPILQAKISMKAGLGNGFLVLPGFLNSGNYVLRGYTNWMKNFSPEFYFEQTITIVNTLKRVTAGSSVKHDATIQFFPEGGNWIGGISAKIAFKALDSNGIGLNCQGAVINQNNDTVVSFRSFHNGMGAFQFKPEPQSAYYAVLRIQDSLIKQKLPALLEHGICMDLETVDRETVRVRVHATPDFENTPVYLFVQTRQVEKNIQTGKLNNGEAVFTLNKKDLGDGISTITIFDGQQRPVCERLVFKRQEKNLTITTVTDQPVYGKRSQVDIDLLTRSDNKAVQGNLSVSVFMVDELQKIPEQDIVTYLYLSSDLKGNIESPGYYFESTDKSTDEALDVLLLTQGWRRFIWNDVLSDKKPVFEFIPELEGPIVTGRIIDKTTGAAVAGADAIISIPGADDVLNISSSDDRGMVRFAFRDIYRNNAVVIQPATKIDSNNRIDITSAWSKKYSSHRINPFFPSKIKLEELLNRSIDNQIENTYDINKKRLYRGDNRDTSSFYGQADKVYFLDNYIRYQTMEEVLREYVNDVRVRKDGERFNLRVKNSQTDLYFEGFPLMMLDGIPIDDPSIIIGLDPLTIKKIEVIAHQYYIGSFTFYGIINVKSYSNEIGATKIDANATVVGYEGIQPQREFYAPSFGSESGKQNRLPDYRNVLHWAPQISTGPDGKSHLSFFTSDVSGKFVVFVQGISPEGLPGKSIIQFEVSDSK
jgi:hypothetical protein